MSTLSHVPSASEITFNLANSQPASTRAEDRERRARMRTAGGLVLALTMIYGYDLVILVTGLRG